MEIADGPFDFSVDNRILISNKNVFHFMTNQFITWWK